MKQKSLLILSLSGCILSILLMRLHPLFLISALGCALWLFCLACAHLKNSQTDALTGLSNLHRLQQLEKHYNQCPHLTAAYVDLNDLKQVNDTLGHNAGNEALKDVAKYLQGICHRGDTAYRIGGDEFLLISKTATAEELTDRFAIADSAIENIDISYGIASGTFPLDHLIHTAEQNMYTMKD